MVSQQSRFLFNSDLTLSCSGTLVDSLQPHFIDGLQTRNAVGASKEAAGGNGGNPFDFFHSVNDMIAARLVEVRVRSGSVIDAIQLVYSYGDHAFTTPWYGGSGGAESFFTLAPGELIVKIEGRSGSLVDQVQFITNRSGNSLSLSFTCP